MCSFSSSIFKLWFHLNVPLNHFNDRWQFYESPIPRKIGDVYATMYYWSRIPLHMGMSTNNTRAAKLGYQAKKEFTFEPKGLPERDTMFLYIPLFMAKWAARMNNIYQHHVLAQQPIHPCLGEGANQSSSKSNINLKIRFLTDDNARRGSWNQPCKSDTVTVVNQVNMICSSICCHKPWDFVSDFWVWGLRVKWLYAQEKTMCFQRGQVGFKVSTYKPYCRMYLKHQAPVFLRQHPMPCAILALRCRNGPLRCTGWCRAECAHEMFPGWAQMPHTPRKVSGNQTWQWEISICHGTIWENNLWGGFSVPSPDCQTGTKSPKSKLGLVKRELFGNLVCRLGCSHPVSSERVFSIFLQVMRHKQNKWGSTGTSVGRLCKHGTHTYIYNHN